MKASKTIETAALCLAAAALAGAAASHAPAGAQGLRAIEPIPGYVCMALNATDQQMMDPRFEVPIRRAPAPDAPVLGIASATVIVAEGVAPVNGFRRVLHLNGEVGWIAARAVKPWVNPGGTGERCVPSLMSNGRPGFASR